MKFLIVVCLAVAAVAEPDAQVLLNSPFYSGLTYNTPLAYNTPLVYNTPLTYAVKPEEVKKEEPKEEKVVVEEKKVIEVAKPVVYSTVPYTTPMIYNTQPIAYTSPMVYKTAVVPKYVAKNGEVEHIVAKREAEADPALLYSNAFGYNYMPYAYNMMPYTTYAAPAMTYAAPAMTYAATPVVYKTEDVKAKTYANDFSPFTQTYAAKGMYVADSVGARHVAKREAESQYFGYATPYAYNYNSYYPYTRSVYSTPYAYSPYYRYF